MTGIAAALRRNTTISRMSFTDHPAARPMLTILLRYHRQARANQDNRT